MKFTKARIKKIIEYYKKIDALGREGKKNIKNETPT